MYIHQTEPNSHNPWKKHYDRFCSTHADPVWPASFQGAPRGGLVHARLLLVLVTVLTVCTDWVDLYVVYRSLLSNTFYVSHPNVSIRWISLELLTPSEAKPKSTHSDPAQLSCSCTKVMALLIAAKPFGMSANFTPSEGEHNPQRLNMQISVFGILSVNFPIHQNDSRR